MASDGLQEYLDAKYPQFRADAAAINERARASARERMKAARRRA